MSNVAFLKRQKGGFRSRGLRLTIFVLRIKMEKRLHRIFAIAILFSCLALVGQVGKCQVTAESEPSVVIIFSPECPVCRNHINDVNLLAEEFPNTKIELLFSSKNFSEDEVRKFMIRYRLKVDWSIDQNDVRIKQLGASVMPTAYVLNGVGSIVYSGKINDRPVRLGKVKPRAQARYVHDAVSALKGGLKPEISRTEPIGCLLN